jgi:hypothetical protein
MREFVHREQDRHDHSALLRRRVEAARAEIGEGLGYSDEEVEADFAARRARIVDRA